ncbi:hypothetical protein BJF93_06670 [Xaviernesmea oryzae]|uniref:GtrA/DPMS transmembrane domain-containing protein n=1 Tax=Xaviernesmea oryzae TaxID=464029 RepID=A0A1Q9ASF1_9HYPH|nr:GtrA family protein [Xaviernesmea oryzae]OLP58291.1 hypothetical protein BJF93_06670 [Xaviernesmea oryzae]SEL43189.1 Putative flippase GtrA (transmembrane translocase of bactoprenol-linked glucose) [Xaviernesmea oryzae]
MVEHRPALFEQAGRGLLPPWAQASLFALVGVVNTAVDIAAFAGLVFFGLAPLMANLISFSLGALNSLVLNKTLTFRGTGARYSLRLVASFAVVTLVALTISQLSLAGMIALGQGHMTAKLVSVVFTFAVSFVLNKFITFRSAPRHG